MSDFETITAMLNRAGIEWTVETAACPDHAVVTCAVKVEESPGRSCNHGYMGFFTEMKFTADGTLVCMGAWE